MKGILVVVFLMFLAVNAETRIEDEDLEPIKKDSAKGLVQGDDDDDNFGGIGGGIGGGGIGGGGIGGGGIGGGGIGGGGIGGGGDDDDDDNGSGTGPPPQACVGAYRQCMWYAWTPYARQVCAYRYRQCVRIMSNPCYKQRLICLRNAGWNYYKRYWCEVRYRKCLDD